MDGKEPLPGMSQEEFAVTMAGHGARFEYEIMRAKATVNDQGVVTGVKGIEDDVITRKAREGWRVISCSWAGRKLVAVFLERPVKK